MRISYRKIAQNSGNQLVTNGLDLSLTGARVNFSLCTMSFIILCTLTLYSNLPKESLFFFLPPFQDYFISCETGQSVGGAKTGEPGERNPGTPASRTWLVSHVPSAGLEPTPDSGEMNE